MVNENAVRERLHAVVLKEAPVTPEALTGSTRLVADCGFDSLEMMQLISSLEAAFALPRIADAEAVTVETLDDAEDLVLRALGRKNGGPPALRAAVPTAPPSPPRAHRGRARPPLAGRLRPRRRLRLSALDSSFVIGEDVFPGFHGHVGSVVILEGPAPSPDALAEHVAARLGRLPRFRQRMATPPGGLARPVWVDDARFALEDHLRHASVPSPGGDPELRELMAAVLSERLPRDRALWQLWLLDGMSEDRWALMLKLQHAMMDGTGLVRDLRALLDAAPDAQRPAPPAWRAWPEPAPITLLAEAAGDGVRAACRATWGLARAIAAPQRALERARAAKSGFTELAQMGREAKLESPLNAPSGVHRRLQWLALDLGDLKAVGRRHDATANDVVVAMVAGAVRRWCARHEIVLEGHALRAMVPVKLREGRQEARNSLAMLAIELPVHAPGPHERLDLTAAATRAAKNSSQSVATGTVLRAQDLIPERALGRAGRLLWEARDVNVTVTSPPGKLETLYFQGRRALDVAPVGFLTPGLTLTFAVLTYDDSVTVSLIGDRQLLADLDEVAAWLRDEAGLLGVGFRELGTAGAATGAATAAPTATVRPTR
ncbi:MAG: diacylglycerol O-acyltransferase / wax synthase [Solirubrobacteraceae bacterium]|nr:diacylglycerol O-acyltransferase / wax synthase [Solirubrobacteraceae bacterium]